MGTQYRIKLIFVFLVVVVLIGLTTQTFYTEESGVELSGLSMALVLPYRFLGTTAPDLFAQLDHSILYQSVDAWISLSEGQVSIGLVYTYLLSGIMALTLVVLVLSLLTTLFRVIFNLPYGHGRGLYLFMLFLSLFQVGLCYAGLKLDFVTNMIQTENSFGLLYEPALFNFIFTGGFLVLYIFTRIASKKTVLI